MVKAFSHKKMEDDDVIIPATYKENTGISTVLHIIAGLILGMLAFYFLMMPARERDLNRQRDEELTSYIQMLNNANQEKEDLQEEYDALEAQAQDCLLYTSHAHNVGTHDRCKTTVEPMVKQQWFVKMEEMAKPAIEALKSGELKFCLLYTSFGKKTDQLGVG